MYFLSLAGAAMCCLLLSLSALWRNMFGVKSQLITSSIDFCLLIEVALKTWSGWRGKIKWILKTVFFSVPLCWNIRCGSFSLKRSRWGISQPSGCKWEPALLHGSSAACQGEETVTLLHRSSGWENMLVACLSMHGYTWLMLETQRLQRAA